MQTEIPGRQENKLAWYGPELHADPDKWVSKLSDAEISEIEDAAGRIVEQGKSIVDIQKENFPLPLIGPRLEDLTEQLVGGIGFALLRRIPVERFSTQQAATIMRACRMPKVIFLGMFVI